MKTVIFDLDGTLADLTHRLHFIKRDKPDWGKFYERCGRDSVNKWCKELMSLMSEKYNIIILSGRSREVLGKTKKWLIKNEISFHGLVLVRGESNFSPDQELKKKWFRENFRGKKKNNILFVVDDRQRVVDMWRNEGLVCLQCNAWEEFKKQKKGE